MNYAETLDWLYTQLPMFQRQGAAAMKKDLTNTRLLLAALDNPERKLKVIHVGGTNGKGSTAHLIASVLQATGAKVGVYTSPHYKDFRERIKINGQLVDEDFVVDFIEAIREEAAMIQPSFFELTVAMAFQYFAVQEVDFAVIEVGLGGRLDSTNVVDPILSVITNISKDHTQFLGETLSKIAYEKAGIIKTGKPVIIGETHPETEGVFQKKAAETGSRILFADQFWQCTEVSSDEEHTVYQCRLNDDATNTETFTVNLHGPFQHLNLQTTLAALYELHALNEIVLLPALLATGFATLKSKTYFIGRWQLLGKQPLIIADSAHNIGGLEPVLAQLTRIATGQLHLVIGVVDDKDLAGVLPLFPKTARYYFVKADIPRGLPASELAATAKEYGLTGQVYSSVTAGFEVAKDTAGPEDTIFVGGSIFTVAEVL